MGGLGGHQNLEVRGHWEKSHACTYVCTQHVHMHTHAHTPTHTHAHTHTWMQAHPHTHAHTHLPGCVHTHCLAIVSMKSNTHFCKGTLTAEIKRSEVKPLLATTCTHTYKGHLPFFLYCLCLLQFVFPRFIQFVHQLLCLLK